MTARSVQPSRMLTPEGVADELAITPEHVRRLIRRGQLPAVNIGSPGRPTYRIFRDALDQYLRDHAA